MPILSALEQWTLVGVAATAIFTGATALVTWLAYQHGRSHAGASKPLVLSPARDVPLLFNDRAYWREMRESEWSRRRVCALFVRNQSSVRQVLRITETRVVWPRGIKSHIGRFSPQDEIVIEPHSGGNVEFLLDASAAQWRDEPPPESGVFYKKRCLVRMKGLTTTGHTVRYMGWVQMRYFKGENTTNVYGTLWSPQGRTHERHWDDEDW